MLLSTRRADRVRARRDGDPRPRRGRRLVHGVAGGHPHRLRPHEGEDPRDPRRPDPSLARGGQDRARRGIPGLLARHDGHHDARSRGGRLTAVALAATLGAACEIHSDVAGVYTADPRIVPGARKIPVGLVRRDARDGRVRRQGAGAAVGRARSQPQRADPRTVDVLRRGGNLGAGRTGNGATDRHGGHPLGDGRRLHAHGHPRPARRRGDDLRRRRRGARQRRHDHPERRPRACRDVVLRAGRGRRRDPRGDRVDARRARGLRGRDERGARQGVADRRRHALEPWASRRRCSARSPTSGSTSR